MSAQFRPKLGMGLQNLVTGDKPEWNMPDPFDPTRPMQTDPGTGNMQAKKPGFFGEGGMGRYLAGAIGDALLQNGGMAPVFAPMQQEKRRAETEQAQWGLRRQADLQDYEQKQQIEQRYAKPAAPHYFETNNGSVGAIGPDGKPQILYTDPTPKMNFIPDGLGGGQWVAVPGQAPSMPAAPTAQPGGLPEGYTVRKSGGGVGNGTGGFRR